MSLPSSVILLVEDNDDDVFLMKRALKSAGIVNAIQVVEDGQEARESLGMLLMAWSHEVTFAVTGPEGLERALEIQPDVVIIDIGLPGLDGYHVASGIRLDGSTWARRVKLIALTGYGQAEDRVRAIDAGFDVHVLKPVDPVELRALL